MKNNATNVFVFASLLFCFSFVLNKRRGGGVSDDACCLLPAAAMIAIIVVVLQSCKIRERDKCNDDIGVVAPK